MYCIDRRRIVYKNYCLLNSARNTAFLLQVSHTTVFKWLRNAEREECMRSALESDILKHCLRPVVQNRLFVHLAENKSDDCSHHRNLCFSTASSCPTKRTGAQSQEESPSSHSAICCRNPNERVYRASRSVRSTGSSVSFFC
jgi:hypothetical protein